jgi:hypothetical protein
MFTIVALTLPSVLLGLKFGAEDRPGFDERAPLS